MIPAEKHTHQVASTLGGETVVMDIDQDAIQHLMHILTNLYSNAPFAILREYATNAWDSHIEAGNPMPIQVILPTPKAPFLRIKDFGVGLNADDIRNVYSKYGKTTKTHSSEATGSLGLGAKSALAYTNQFTVVGIKDGTLTSVSVSLDEEGVGSMTIVDESETDTANGVEIIVPVKTGDHERFAAEASKLFRYWPAGRVLVEGEEPERFEGLKVTDQITLLKGERHRDQYGYLRAANNYVIMAGVPYPIEDDHFTFDLPEAYTIVAEIPNGSIHFTPSREHLDYTKRTRAVLEQLQEDLKQGILDSITGEITAASKPAEALRIAIKWREALPKMLREQKFQYRNTEIPSTIAAPPDGSVFLVAHGERQTDYYGKARKVGYHSRMQAIDLTMVPEAVWVYNFRRTFTPTVKKKLWQHFDNLNQPYPPNFIMCADKPQSPWIDSANVIDWTPIEAIKLPRVNAATGRNMTGRIPGSYDLYMVLGDTPEWLEDVPGDEIETEIPIRYLVNDKNAARIAATKLAHCEDEFSLVMLTSNRVAKFKRLFPEACAYHDVMNEYGGQFELALTDLEREAVAIRQSEVQVQNLKQLPQIGLADPDLVRAKRLVNWQPAYVARLAEGFDLFGIPQPIWTNPLQKYPLYRSPDDYWRFHGRVKPAILRQHSIVYLNAVYQELLNA